MASLSLIFTLLFAGVVFSSQQCPSNFVALGGLEVTYDHYFNGYDVAVDSDGIYQVGLFYYDDDYDAAVLVKTDLDGNLVYMTLLSDLSDDDEFVHVDVMGDHVYAAGYVSAISGLVVSKFTKADGVEVWSKFFNADIEPDGIIVTSDTIFLQANYRATGYRIFKMDLDGNVQFDFHYDDVDLYASGFALYNDFLYVVGRTPNTPSDGLLFKVSATDGSFVWGKKVEFADANLNNYVFEVKANSQGLFIVGRGFLSATGKKTDIMLAKYDFDGNNEWLKMFGTPETDYPDSMSLTDSEIYIYSRHDGNDDPVIIKTDLDGNILWSRTFANDLHETYPETMTVFGDYIYLNGYDYHYFGNDDYETMFLIKMNTDGTFNGFDTLTIEGNFQPFYFKPITFTDTPVTPTFGTFTLTAIDQSPTTFDTSFDWDINGPPSETPIWEVSNGYSDNVYVLIDNDFQELGWTDSFLVPFWDSDPTNRLFAVSFVDQDGDSIPSDGDLYSFGIPCGLKMKCDWLGCRFSDSVEADEFTAEVIEYYDTQSDMVLVALSKGGKYLSYTNGKMSLQAGRKSAAIFKISTNSAYFTPTPTPA